MPTVYIWRPQGEDNPYGHVSLKTDKFYISFWPSIGLGKDGNKYEQLKEVFEFTAGVRGMIVFNQNVDRENENDCDPIEYSIEYLISDQDINEVYEEFLHYNKIYPGTVTLAIGEELFRREPELPQLSIRKTKYSFTVELITNKEDSVPFYHQQQSCVSFVFNVIQTAWLKNNPDQPIPIWTRDAYRTIVPKYHQYDSNITSDSKYREFPFTVEWFEEEILISKRYLMTGNVMNKPTTTVDPLTEIRQMIKTAKIFIFILSLLFFWFPELRYPVLFGGFMYPDPSSSFRWIFSLFLMLLVYYVPLIGHFFLFVIMFCYHSFDVWRSPISSSDISQVWLPPSVVDAKELIRDIERNPSIWKLVAVVKFMLDVN